MLIDANNFGFITRHSKLQTAASERQKDPMAVQVILFHMIEGAFNIAKLLGATTIIVVEDSPNNWRRQKFEGYKANSKSSEDIYFDEVIKAIGLFSTFIREQTNGIVLKVDDCEGDDVISVWCANSSGVKNIILSSDTDYTQLYSEETSIYSPTQKVFRTSENVDYDLFVRCIRGGKDNVTSAYPRVRETVLKAAWEDPIKMTYLMETNLNKSTEEDAIPDYVKDRYAFNKSMIDRHAMPNHLQQYTLGHIKQQLSNATIQPRSDLSALKFLGKLNIKNQDNMFNHKEHLLRGVPVLNGG